jgi:hypothetical protein
MRDGKMHFRYGGKGRLAKLLPAKNKFGPFSEDLPSYS